MFKDLTFEETESVNAGGLLSCIAGTLAGTVVGGYGAMIAAANGADAQTSWRIVLTGAAAGACCVFIPAP